MVLKKKICLLGAFAVGKTSLIQKFVYSIFSEKYISSVGVKIDKKTVTVNDQVLEMLLWDLYGEDEFQSVQMSYLRGFTAYAQERDPSIVFKTLNGYLRAMIEPILSTNGVVDKIIGDGVMALFGLEREPSPPEVGAVQAALRIVDAVRKLSVESPEASGAVLGVGVGIASGQVALGILGSHDRRDLSVIGHNVNFAARLEHEARPGEILIDALTFGSIGTLQDRFRPRVLALKGLQAALQVYACGVAQ